MTAFLAFCVGVDACALTFFVIVIVLRTEFEIREARKIR